MSTLPDFQKDVEGQCYGGAFWSPAEYRIRIVQITPGDRFQMTVELGDGTKVGETTLSDAEADGIIRMGSTDHSLSGYEDDWKIPAGMDRVIEWTLQTDINHTVRLDENVISEIGAWFGFALGFEVWDGGEEWEF